MNSKYLLAAIVVIAIVLIYLYHKGDLNKFLPKSWQHHTKSPFVGAYGRTPAMQGCLVFAGKGQKETIYNRCASI